MKLFIWTEVSSYQCRDLKLPLSWPAKGRSQRCIISASWTTSNRLPFWYPASTTEHKAWSALRTTLTYFEKFTFDHICGADKTRFYTFNLFFLLQCILVCIIFFCVFRYQYVSLWPDSPNSPFLTRALHKKIKNRLGLSAYLGTAYCYCQPGPNLTKKPSIFGWICMQTENLVFNPVWPQFSLLTGRNPS